MQPLPQLIPPPDPYSLGPQGDPFAATSAQVATQALADKHVPRKRNYRVGVECFKCKNPETQNRQGNPESLRPCEECGRAGKGLGYTAIVLAHDEYGTDD
jgi:ribosomal protein L37AE/L43A